MADGFAKQRRALALANGEQGDFKLEVDELFDDHFLAVAAHARARVVPAGLNVGGGFGHALAFARRAHHGFDDHRKTNRVGLCQEFFRRLGVVELGGAHAQTHRHIADAVAVHGEVGGLRAGDDLKAFLLHVQQHLGADGLDLGHDQIRLVLGDGGTQGCFIQHVEHARFVGHLHGGCARVAVASHHIAAQALGADDEFFAQFT